MAILLLDESLKKWNNLAVSFEKLVNSFWLRFLRVSLDSKINWPSSFIFDIVTTFLLSQDYKFQKRYDQIDICLSFLKVVCATFVPSSYFFHEETSEAYGRHKLIHGNHLRSFDKGQSHCNINKTYFLNLSCWSISHLWANLD